MNFIRLFDRSVKQNNDAEEELRKRNVSRFSEIEPVSENGISVFNPVNILYIRKSFERSRFIVHLIQPIGLLKGNKVEKIHSYSIRSQTAKELLIFLKSDFVKAAHGLIVRQTGIVRINMDRETITIRDKNNENHLRTLHANRSYLKQIKNQGILAGIQLSKDIVCDGFIPECALSGNMIINPVDVCYIKKEEGSFSFRLLNDFTTKQPRFITWRSRKSFGDIIIDSNAEKFLIQISRNYVVSLYCLMRSTLIQDNKIKLLVDYENDEWVILPIGTAFRKKLKQLFQGLI